MLLHVLGLWALQAGLLHRVVSWVVPVVAISEAVVPPPCARQTSDTSGTPCTLAAAIPGSSCGAAYRVPRARKAAGLARQHPVIGIGARGTCHARTGTT